MNANILQIISTFTLESIQLNQISLYEHLRFWSNDLFPSILIMKFHMQNIKSYMFYYCTKDLITSSMYFKELLCDFHIILLVDVMA